MYMCKTLELKRFLLRKSGENFDTGILKKLGKFQYLVKKLPYEKKVSFPCPIKVPPHRCTSWSTITVSSH